MEFILREHGVSDYPIEFRNKGNDSIASVWFEAAKVHTVFKGISKPLQDMIVMESDDDCALIVNREFTEAVYVEDGEFTHMDILEK